MELGGCMGEPWKRMGERRRHMGKAARICGDCWHGGRRLYGERKPHENPECGSGRRPADFADFWQCQRGGSRVWRIASSRGHVGERPAGACRRMPPRETAETSPCTALPRRAAHAIGSPTGRQSSPGRRRGRDRGRGMHVCRSSPVRTWGTSSSWLQPSTTRRDPLHTTHTGRHGSRSSGHPAHARACSKIATCLPGSQMRTVTTTPRSSRTKICTKCKPLSFSLQPAPDRSEGEPGSFHFLRPHLPYGDTQKFVQGVSRP